MCVFFSVLKALVKLKFRVILRVLTLLIPNMTVNVPHNPSKLRKDL